MDKKLPTVKFKDTEIGDFIFSPNLSFCFEVVRSGDFTSFTFDPDAPVLRCYYSREKDRMKEGETTIDYFNIDFVGPFKKGFVDNLIQTFKKEGDE